MPMRYNICIQFHQIRLTMDHRSTSSNLHFLPFFPPFSSTLLEALVPADVL